jgi:hypothetical protein
MLPKNLINKRFSKLRVIKRQGSNVRGLALWLCKCDCGNQVTVIGANLRQGISKSCGCQRLEKLQARNLQHGHAFRGRRNPTYMSWVAMKQRVSRQSYKYPIKVTSKWLNYNNFLKDMGPRPQGFSLDRINVKGNYEPSNCRWANSKFQARNKTNTRYIEYQQKRKSVAEWSDIVNIPSPVIRARIDKLGWGVKKALTTPYIKQKRF